MRVRDVTEKSQDELLTFCRGEYPRLVGLLTLYCGNQAIAEELAQETLARAWHRWPRVHRLDRPEAWTRRVAINLANSHLRRILAERKALRQLPATDVHEDATDRGLLDVVARLPRRQRAVVILHYYLDLPLEEVALQLETTIPSVKSLLHRALKRLRALTETKDLVEVPDVT